MRSMLVWPLLIISGVFVAIQPLVNARLSKSVGMMEAALVSFLGGTLLLILIVSARGFGQLRQIGQAPAWSYIGGLLGATFVCSMIFAVPRIGVTAAVGIAIATQLITGLVLDHYGLMGSPVSHVDLRRALGVVLLIVGVLLIRWKS
jgi:transporter family-2 protein